MTGSDSRPGPEPNRLLAVLLLMLFASIFPEVLSLSTPVGVLFGPRGPLGFLQLLGEYGCGAVLVWEAIARWNKGWLAVVPLGAAYGIAEEGFATKVFIDPAQQLRIDRVPGPYGNWSGVEWANFVPIDIFHAAVSIGLQLLVVALLFPQLKGRPLLGHRGLFVVATAFAADIGLQFFTVDPTPILSLLPSLVFMGALGVTFVAAGRLLPRDALASWMRSKSPSTSPRAFFAVGFGWLLSLLVVFIVGSNLVPWALALIVFYLLSSGGALYFLVTLSGWQENRSHQIAFVGGMAGAFLVWDAVPGAAGGDVGALAFAGLFVAIVLYLWKHRSDR